MTILQKILRPFRIIRPILRLKNHTPILQTHTCMILSHRHLHRRALPAGLKHKLRSLVPIGIIELLPHLSPAHNHSLRSIIVTMNRNYGISHQNIQHPLRLILPPLVPDTYRRLSLGPQIKIHPSPWRFLCTKKDFIKKFYI